MSSSRINIANIQIETPLAQTCPLQPPPRPRSSSRRRDETVSSAQASHKRASSSNSTRSARPYAHVPCSSTLGKFHDSVNHSLMHENDNANHHQYRSNTPRSNHPVLEAKLKFKYMTNTKSYVDETLFGMSAVPDPAMVNPYYNIFYGNGSTGTTPRCQADIYQHARNHLSHNLMSNMAPLMLAPAPSSRLNSARPDSGRKENSDPVGQRKGSAAIASATRGLPPRPWKP